MAMWTGFGAAFEALRECACAIQSGDLSRADLSMKRALDLSEDDNESDLVTYFAQALARRAYRLLPKYPPDFSNCYLDGKVFYPYRAAKLIGDIIAKADLSGKSKIHLIFFSLNWFSQETLSFMKERLEKVPQMCLKITLVETSNNSCTTIEKLVSELANSGYITTGFDSLFGDHLRCRAQGINFEYNRVVIINNSLDELEVSRLKIDRDDEFVVVNCYFLLGCMLPVALNKFLLMLRDDINPDMFILVEYDANLNQSEFLLRFDESLQYYSNIYSYLRKRYGSVSLQFLQNEISNVVAYEGGARVVRHMTSDQWRDLLNKSGFSSVPILHDNELRLINGFLKIYDEDQERPLCFFSAWEIKESSFDEGFYHNSLDGDDNFQNLRISPDPQHRSLIRMSSLAEIHDMTCQKFKDYKDDYHMRAMFVWEKCEDNHLHGRSSDQLNPCLCIVDQIGFISKVPIYMFGAFAHLQERNHVTKAFESNRPCFVPDIKDRKKDLLPYLLFDVDLINGAFAIKLNSLYASCGGYVVQVLFEFPEEMRLENRRRVMDKILCNLRSEKSSFVTISTLDELKETPDVLCIINSPSVQSQSHNNVMDWNAPLLHQSSTPNAKPVSGAQGELFLPYGSSTPLAKPTRDQNILVDSSTRDIDLNDELSFDNWLFSNLTVGDELSSWPPHQLDKEQEALKNVSFTPLEASQYPSKPNASEGQRDCVMVGLDNAQTSQNVISRAVAEKGKTVFQETIPIDKGKLFSKRQFQVGMSFTTCGRTGNDNSPSWEKKLNFKYGADGSVKPNMAKPPAVISNSKFTYGVDGSVKPKMAKPPAVISNAKAQCSSHAYGRKITKERQSTWSKKV